LAGVAAAVSAGTLPDVIKGWLGDSVWFLSILCVVTAGIFAFVNWWQHRRRGVGIVLTLPSDKGPAPWNPQWSRAAVDHARRLHDSCFLVHRPIQSPTRKASPVAREAAARERRDTLELANELAAARLAELSEADPAAPVSLYVDAALPDAFELGSMFKFNVHRRLTAVEGPEGSWPGLGDDEDGDGDADRGPVLPQRSEETDTDFFEAVRIGARLKEPLTPTEQARVERFVRVDTAPPFAADPKGDAVALVVHLADNPGMVREALNAAGAGCLDSDGKPVRCRAALVIDGGPANIPENRADFELVVRYVYASWRAWLTEHHEYGGLRPRLFISAPATIGFALGWLLRQRVKVVPFPYRGLGG
jgi:hypothetical protein